MSDQKSTMSPKIIYHFCVLQVFNVVFSNSKVEVEVVVEPGIENTEKEIEEKNSPKVMKVKKLIERDLKKDVIVTEENSEYIPQSLRENLKIKIKNDYIPQSQRED